jgi:hypothetical protein
MNPYLTTISILNLSAADSQGDWAFLYLLFRALGDGFSDSGNNVHTRNAPKEALRRIALIEGTGHGYQRLAFLLNPSIIAYDSR